MTIELKPCPFCGSDHLFISTNTLNQIEYMNCAQCGARHPADKWNTRAESAEVERLRARIAELEAENFKLAAGQCVQPKGIIGDDYGNATCPIADKKPIATGWVIVDESPPLVCYAVHDTINEAWEEFQGGCNTCREESMEDTKKRAEQNGCRAVKVAVVRVDE